MFGCEAIHKNYTQKILFVKVRFGTTQKSSREMRFVTINPSRLISGTFSILLTSSPTCLIAVLKLHHPLSCFRILYRPRSCSPPILPT